MKRFVVVIWFLLSCYGLFLRMPSVGVPSVSHLDKVAHFAMFFGQFYLLGWAFVVKQRAGFVRLWLIALGWAMASELIQGAFTERNMDFWDSVADMMGATLAMACLYTQNIKKGDMVI